MIWSQRPHHTKERSIYEENLLKHLICRKKKALLKHPLCRKKKASSLMEKKSLQTRQKEEHFGDSGLVKMSCKFEPSGDSETTEEFDVHSDQLPAKSEGRYEADLMSMSDPLQCPPPLPMC